MWGVYSPSYCTVYGCSHLQVVYDICARLVYLSTRQNRPTRIKDDNEITLHHQNGAALLDGTYQHPPHHDDQLQQHIEAVQVTNYITLIFRCTYAQEVNMQTKI